MQDTVVYFSNSHKGDILGQSESQSALTHALEHEKALRIASDARAAQLEQMLAVMLYKHGTHVGNGAYVDKITGAEYAPASDRLPVKINTIPGGGGYRWRLQIGILPEDQR